MRRQVFLLPAALAVLVALHPAAAQKFIPKSIQFQGDPEYSAAELMAAAGLKKGVALNFDQMKAYTQRLLDTGVFSTLAFRFDGQDLIFTLAPNSDLYPIRFENLPLTSGKDLDAKLHEQLPLYHGKVPADGGLAESVRAALENLLLSEGLQATVIAATAADPATQKVNAVSYSISAPPVQTAVARLDGVSAPYQAKVQAILAKATDAGKFPFDTAHSADNLARAVTQFYNDEGFAAAKVEVERAGDPAMASGAIQVPFSVQVQEGRVYKVGSIQLPSGAPVSQAEIDKILSGSLPEGVRIRSVWVLISQRYKSKGYLDCKLTPRPAFDDAAGAVSYTVDVDPGAVYHLGFVKFDNVTDELRTLLIHNWQMLPGDPFDESYVSNFISKAQTQDPVLKRSLTGVKVKFDATANPATHEVNVTIRLEK
jgi:outer membrane protein insertion porin family